MLPNDFVPSPLVGQLSSKMLSAPHQLQEHMASKKAAFHFSPHEELLLSLSSAQSTHIHIEQHFAQMLHQPNLPIARLLSQSLSKMLPA